MSNHYVYLPNIWPECDQRVWHSVSMGFGKNTSNLALFSLYSYSAVCFDSPLQFFRHLCDSLPVALYLGC